jgi:hypothetical protein
MGVTMANICLPALTAAENAHPPAKNLLQATTSCVVQKNLPGMGGIFAV